MLFADDLAFNKPARQKEERESFSASLAVDNDNDTCTNPQNVKDPWWRVDIGHDVIVRGLIVYVENSTRDVLKIFSVEVEADGSADRKMCFTYSNPSGRLPVPYTFTCLQYLIGRHVIITGYTGNAMISLRLCSVGVYGRCVPGTYGTYCTETCGNCKNASTCNPTTGQCPSGCDVGYTGSTCKDNVNECAQNPCKNGATCNNLQNGYSCKCTQGWQGLNCDQGCSGIRSDTDGTGHILYTAPEYEDDRHCVLVVRTATYNHVVQVHFNRFKIEDSDNCEFESLNIFSGERTDSASLGGPYCASSLDDRTFLSSGNTMRLVFKMDHSLSFFGFQANFTFLHIDQLDKDCGCRRNTVCVVQGFEKMCIGGSTCSVASCANGAVCVNNGSVDHCYCTAGYTGNFCTEKTGSAGRLKFKQELKSRKVMKGAQFESHCQVEKPVSGDRVVYSWYHEGNLIGDYHSNNKFGDLGEGTLMINNFKEQFEGRYTCEARAGNSTTEQTFTLKMVEECVLDMKGPSDDEEDAGKIVILSCSAFGATDIWWERSYEKIDTESTGSKFTKMDNKYLRIANVSTQDSGMYTCVAKDTRHCESRRSGTLTILNRGPYER
ncbi:hypothetical protein DPMN_016832, partial [Dreissena polymorpha]